MGKRSKILLICGAAAIGVISVLIVIVALIASGAISLTQEKIVFASQSAEFIYDGQTHTCEEWYIADGELSAGHTADVTVMGSQTEVGKSSNSIYVVIYDSSGVDVTEYYNIEYQEGTLTVYAVSITVESDSAEKIYDGTPLSADTYSIYGGQLLSGHYEVVTFTNTLTEAGIKQNYFNINIYDSQGADKTSCYDITCIYGELAIYYGMLEISTPSAERVYDGTALTATDWKLISGSLTNGHVLSVTLDQSITNVGTIENTPYVTVMDASGAIVTEYYKITYYTGTLTVTPYTIKLHTGTAAKEYDGTALTNSEYEIYSAADIISGHTMSVNVYGSQTDAGQSENYADVAIYDASGAVVTSNYDIQMTYGTLTVTAIKITVISGSATKPFDGKPLTCTDYAVVPEGSIPDGQTISVNVTGSRTYKGEAENTFTVTIYGTDSGGNRMDVTYNYDITYQYGELVVTGEAEYYESDLFVGSNTLEKGNLYTFAAQVDGIYSFTADGSFSVDGNSSSAYTVGANNPYTIELKAGQSIEIGANADLTMQISCVYALNEGNNYLTDGENYYFKADSNGTYSFTLIGSGSIEVTDGSGTVYSIAGGETSGFSLSLEDTLYVAADGSCTLVIGSDADTSSSDSGSEGSSGGSGGTGGVLDKSGDISYNYVDEYAEASTVLNIYSETTGTLYLKLISFGNYRGSGWDAAATYDTLLDGIYGMDYLYGSALANGGYSASYFAVDSYTSDYMLPYYLAMASADYAIGYDVQTSDIYYTGSSTNYSGYVYYYDYLSSGASGLTTSYTAEEAAYRSYVYANYLSTGSVATAEYLQGIIEEQGFDKITDTYSLVKAVVSYVQNAATYNLEYDTTLDSQEDIVVAFLDSYKEGICQHFASAATLLFRQLGIPARYTSGYVAGTTAGQWTEVTTATAHAWTEIYIDGLGWVEVDATGAGGPGSIASGEGSSGGGAGGGSGSYDGDLSVGDNQLEEGGTYEFTADEDGTFSFTGDYDFTITDSSGNTYEIDAGDTFDLELDAGGSVDISADVDMNLDIDGSYSLSEDSNALTEGEDYYFDADVDGNYSFTASGDGSVTITDGNGNTYTIGDGESVDLELGEGESVDIVTDGDVTLDIDGTYALSEDDNLLVDGEDYYFEAELDGGYSFTFVGDGSVIITDGEGNEYELSGGETLDMELTAGDIVDIIADGAGKLIIGVDEDTDVEVSLDTSGDIFYPTGGGGAATEAETVLNIYSETTGMLYLKLISYGDYRGSGWDSASAYSTLLDGVYGMDYLYSSALVRSGYSPSYFEIESSTSDYLLPYYLATSTEGYAEGYDVQTSDVYYTGTSASYSGYVYYYDYLADGADGFTIYSDYTAAEEAYRAYVYANYTSVGADSTADYLQSIIEEQGFDKITDTYALVSAVVNYVQNAATYNIDFDSALNDEEDIVVAFLSSYKEGICQHFASAATLLFRQLGIPARYTNGYVAYTQADAWTKVTTLTAHAWTEVYIDGLGWVEVDATGEGGAGDGSYFKIIDGSGSGSETGGGSGGSGDGSSGTVIEKLGELIVKPLNEYYLYDNTTHSYSGAMLQGLAELTAQGYTYEFTVSGARKSLGVTETVVETFTLYDPEGYDVTEYFDIDYETGKLQVYAVQITVTTGSASMTYNGTTLTCADITVDEYKLISGHTAVYAATGSIKDVGKIINTYTITVYDENGSDVTNWYYFVSDYGTLEVTACDITVTAASDSKILDGTELTNSGYELEGELPEGFTIAVTVQGSQKYVGYSANIVKEVKVYDIWGRDVTGNFNITTVSGTLTVTIF